jgi:hypothetical protein
MKAIGCALAAAFLAAGASALSGDSQAPLLPEIQTHIDFVRKAAIQRRFDLALHHAEVVAPSTLRVFICPRASLQSRSVTLEALRIWSGELNDLVFVQTKENSAQVKITFAPELSVGGLAAGGYASWRRGGSELLEAEVVLRTHINGTAMGREQMLQAALHEIGHVLGLSDSPSGGVMGPLNLNRPVTHPSAAEVAALRAVREQAQSLAQWAQSAWQVQLEGYNFRR